MAEPAQVQRIEQEAVATLLELLRAGGFVRAELFWSVLAGVGSATLTAVDAHGSSAVLQTPDVIFETLDELRSEMTDPDAGAWLSTGVRVGVDGASAWQFNWDRRPYWNSPTPFEPTERDVTDPQPSDETLLLDLAENPRTLEHLPFWYPSAPGDAPVPTARPRGIGDAELLPLTLHALATDAHWLGIADAVRRHLAAVIDEIHSDAGEDADVVIQRAYERVFQEFLEGRTARDVKRIWTPANVAGGYPPKSIDIPDDETVEHPSADLEVLLEDISDVIAVIAEHQLDLMDP